MPSYRRKPVSSLTWTPASAGVTTTKEPNMSSIVVLGTQWGDEGKGKIVHLLGKQADYIVRYQGGPNAGHTVIFDDKKFVLHLIPAGILIPRKICVIANGVVVDPVSLHEEIQLLEKRNIRV